MKTVLSFSGGLDSTVLLWRLLDMGHHVDCLTIDYGQPARGELSAASCVYARAVRFAKPSQDVRHSVLKLDKLHALAGSDGIVRNRRLILASIAAGYAMNVGAESVAFGERCDVQVEGFEHKFHHLVDLCHKDAVSIFAPWIDRTKAGLVDMGDRLGAPLGLTWSCTRAGEHHCGECRGCQIRQWGFTSRGKLDTTVYAARPAHLSVAAQHG